MALSSLAFPSWRQPSACHVPDRSKGTGFADSLVGLGDVASVSKHPLLWKPGAASPKPSNKVRCGAGWRALSGDPEAASKRDGVNYFLLRLEG